MYVAQKHYFNILNTFSGGGGAWLWLDDDDESTSFFFLFNFFWSSDIKSPPPPPLEVLPLDPLLPASADGDLALGSYQKIFMKLFSNKAKLEAQPTEPVSLTFHSAVRKLNTEPSIGASHQISVHFGKAVSEKKIFRNRPI